MLYIFNYCLTFQARDYTAMMKIVSEMNYKYQN